MAKLDSDSPLALDQEREVLILSKHAQADSHAPTTEPISLYDVLAVKFFISLDGDSQVVIAIKNKKGHR
jgi:hypothetical protein